MNSALGIIIASVTIIIVYVAIAELYNTFRVSAYAGTAALILALYFANRTFIDLHKDWPWIVIIAIILAVAEILTFFLARYKKTYEGLILFTCALVTHSLLGIFKVNSLSIFGAFATTIVLLCMTAYTVWSVRKRNIARVRDRGNATTGVIAGIFAGASACVIMGIMFVNLWNSFITGHKILIWIVRILISAAIAVVWILIDKSRDEKQKERYARLANELTLAREHYMNMIRDLDGILEGVPASQKKLITESVALGGDFKRYKQLRNIPVEKMSFYEYNDMLRIYPRLMDTFDPKTDSEDDTKILSRTVQSVYFNGCNDKEELTERYKRLAKVFHTDNAGGDKDSFILLKKEYEEQMAGFKDKGES